MGVFTEDGTTQEKIVNWDLASLDQLRLSSMLSSVNLGLWYCDLPFDKLVWSERCKAHFGLSPDTEVTYDLFIERLHPDDRVRTHKAIEHSIASKTRYDVIYRILVGPASNNVKWIRAIGNPFYNPEGVPVRFDGVTVDITEQKVAEARIVETEDRLRAAIHASGTGTFRWNIKTNDLVWDTSLNLLFGLSPDYKISSLDDFLSFVHPEDRAEVVKSCRASNHEGRDFEMEFRVIWPDGSVHWLLDRGKTFFDSEGRPSYMSGACVDITKRKLDQRRLVEHAEKLARSNQELEQFAHVASHDLKEPLRMVTMNVQLLQQQLDPETHGKLVPYAEKAIEGARRMYKLIDDLLAYSSVKDQDSSETASVSQVFNWVKSALGPAIEESGARVSSRDLPTIRANPHRLEQVLQNLIGNALKFRSEAPPEIVVTAERRQAEWVFCVKDNGIGIKPEYQKKIFSLFQRLHSSEKYPGTGIGLSICQKIIESAGGRIWVTSEPGKGSSFYFSLPV